ncbi:hypothetical protein GCM10028818_57380 [Spirosoma horti]
MAHIGILKWFDESKGIGVVCGIENTEYLIDKKNIHGKVRDFSKGAALVFELKNSGKTAKNIHFIGEDSDWPILQTYLGKKDDIYIEVEITGLGYRGNPYKKRERKKFSLLDLAVKQFFWDKNEQEIVPIVTGYFDAGLNRDLFIEYAGFIKSSIRKYYKTEIANSILGRCFGHFGDKLDRNILFNVWKTSKFEFINYDDKGDYEIPKDILLENSNRLNSIDLNRIKSYTFNSGFYNDLWDKEVSQLHLLDLPSITNLYALLNFIENVNLVVLKANLDETYVRKFIEKIHLQSKNIGLISNNHLFNEYIKIEGEVDSRISSTSKELIHSQLIEVIVEQSSKEYMIELWLKNLVKDLPFEDIKLAFLIEHAQLEKKLLIFSKLDTSAQFVLLKEYKKVYDWEKAYEFLEIFVKKQNPDLSSFRLSEKLFDDNFWVNKLSTELLYLFREYARENISDEDQKKLFFKGLCEKISDSFIIDNIDNFDKNDFEKILLYKNDDKGFILNILKLKVLSKHIDQSEWVYDLAFSYLDSINFQNFDKIVFESFSASDYFKLWELGKAKLFPSEYIDKLISSDSESIHMFDKWIANGLVTQLEINDYLLDYLYNAIPVTDRMVFYSQYNCIKYLSKFDKYLLDILEMNNEFYSLLLWFIDKGGFFDFDLLKSKFIYFYPEDQVIIIKKLFYLKATNRFDLTTKRLDELTRVDVDLYKLNLKLNPDVKLDISSEVIIKSLVSFEIYGKFLVESELLAIAINNIQNNKSQRFKLSYYFEKCLGRQVGEFDWNTQGEIRKVKYGDNKFYFAIYYKEGEWVDDKHSYNSRYEKKPNFEAVKKVIEQLPKCKWNSVENHWGVPSSYESEILNFAQTYTFSFNFEDGRIGNNPHLVKYKRIEVPTGILFCEGRAANKVHESFKKEFWWCVGQPCFSKCETLHSPKDWQDYTLLDFCNILHFDLDETNRLKDHIPNGKYYRFIALINRFNHLLDKLYCQSCNEILSPIDSSHFAAHTIVRFSCANTNCTNTEEVYLNHCLNGKCNSIIDSRVSSKCPNGLFICDSCGSCCSHEMLNRRLTNLREVGGYIHPNLISSVQDKAGHLERAEYFCYKCTKKMIEVKPDVFYCKEDNVTYDTVKFRFKRPNKVYNVDS